MQGVLCAYRLTVSLPYNSPSIAWGSAAPSSNSSSCSSDSKQSATKGGGPHTGHLMGFTLLDFHGLLWQ